MSHITGGGLADNLARVIPGSCEVRIDRTTWQPPPIFGLFSGSAEISEPDLEATFNMGVGMVAVLPLRRGRRGRTPARRAWAAGLGLWIRHARQAGTREAREPLRPTRCGIGSRRFAPLGPLGSLSLTTLTILSRG